MRVAVVDMGTNSTRLLVADVTKGAVVEVERRSVVTRLGEGVDATGRLAAEAQERALRVLDEYVRIIERTKCRARVAVLTSAVRDAANGPAFAATVRDRYGLDASTLSGDEEARLTYLGAVAAGPAARPEPLLVVDIGGGSTELVVGRGGEVVFHVSLQVGVVRHTERHLKNDPPEAAELESLRREVAREIREAVPDHVRKAVGGGVAVAGTPTSAAAIDLDLDFYDASRVEGHVMELTRLDGMLDDLAAMPLDRRRRVTGLHPERAPTIVAGLAVLVEALRAFGLERVEVSERDILWGAALEAGEAVVS